MNRLGIDIGGSGIKGALVDCSSGTQITDRHKILTPRPATTDAVAAVVADVTAHFEWTGEIGVTYPGVVTWGVTRSAANMDPSWLGCDADALFSEATGCPVHVLNDADAAGLAEVRLGGHDTKGLIIMVTLGTGIGTALFHNGILIPNTELGHLELNGRDAELTAAARVRDEHKLSWSQYAGGLQRYLRMVEDLLWPDLFIIGGGISRKAEKFVPLLTEVRTPLTPATLTNEAGIIGAALAFP